MGRGRGATGEDMGWNTWRTACRCCCGGCSGCEGSCCLPVSAGSCDAVGSDVSAFRRLLYPALVVARGAVRDRSGILL